MTNDSTYLVRKTSAEEYQLYIECAPSLEYYNRAAKIVPGTYICRKNRMSVGVLPTPNKLHSLTNNQQW